MAGDTWTKIYFTQLYVFIEEEKFQQQIIIFKFLKINTKFLISDKLLIKFLGDRITSGGDQ